MEFVINNRSKFVIPSSAYVHTGNGMGWIQPHTDPPPKPIVEHYEMSVYECNDISLNNLDEFNRSYVEFIDRPRIAIGNEYFFVDDFEFSELDWKNPKNLKSYLAIQDNSLYFIYAIKFDSVILTGEITVLKIRMCRIPENLIPEEYKLLISKKNRKPKLDKLSKINQDM